VHVNHVGNNRYHSCPDRNRPRGMRSPQSAEVGRNRDRRRIGCADRPFHSTIIVRPPRSAAAYYTLQRRPRLLSPYSLTWAERRGPFRFTRHLVFHLDRRFPHAAVHVQIRRSAAQAFCTNRDLPIPLATPGAHGFTWYGGAPVESVAVCRALSYPRQSPALASTSLETSSAISRSN